MKKIIAVMHIAVLILCTLGCTSEKDIETPVASSDPQAAFSKLISIASVDFPSSSQKDEAAVILEELGLDKNSKTCLIEKTFMEEYLKTNSMETLLNDLNNLYLYMPVYANVSRDITFNKLRTIIISATEAANIELKSIDLNNPGAEGYYTEHTEEYPLIETWEVKGKFYNDSGENVHYQTMPCQLERTYYGDFSIEQASGYQYDEGRYEWVNGTFYNELPSWKPYSMYYLAYKGKNLICESSISMVGIQAKSIRYFSDGDTTYLLFDSSEQYFGDLWKTWETLF